MLQLTGSLTKYPARVSFAWYVLAILCGALLLRLPICRQADADRVSLVDATFTSTSAVCVTGLVVRSTGNEFSFVGQVVILALIQLGGIGIMTVTTFALFQLGGRASLRHRYMISETLGAGREPDLKWILQRVFGITLLCEAAGCLVLTVRFLFLLPPGEAVWHGLFHSVSAFCNAGFALRDDSLVLYQGDVVVNLVISTLVIVGGIGFPVLLDIAKHRRLPWRDAWDHWQLHTKIMLLGTAALLILSTSGFLLLEWNGVLAGMPYGKRGMVSFFHAVSCRTAGFNTIDVARATNATLFLTVLLMVIGAGPCSTAGGFKVSTLMVLLLHAAARFRGYTRINLFRRTIASEVAGRATAVAMLFTVVLCVSLTLLLVFEQSVIPHREAQGLFLDAVFEVASALGTVGLSIGLTPLLSDAGRIIIIVLMFLGRLGPISVFVAISQVEHRQSIEFTTEEPLIG